jgi:hypothetical protein
MRLALKSADVRRWQLVAFSLGAWLVLCGQTSAASNAATSANPAPTRAIRHLEFAFEVEYQRNGESHDSGMDPGGTRGFGSGVTSALGGGGRKGTVNVDVVGFAADGALIVAIQEILHAEARPEERFVCTVYGDGHVACPNADGPLSDAENLLLSLLGRGFIDQQASDARNHWRREYDGKQVSVVTNYTMSDTSSVGVVSIVKHSKITSRSRSVGNSEENGKIVYDRTLSVPDSVHDTVYETLDNSSLLTTVDVTLTADSYGRH